MLWPGMNHINVLKEQLNNKKNIYIFECYSITINVLNEQLKNIHH